MRCTNTYPKQFFSSKNLTLAKLMCNDTKDCNGIAGPTRDSENTNYKLCKGNFEFSQHDHIFAKGIFIIEHNIWCWRLNELFNMTHSLDL